MSDSPIVARTKVDLGGLMKVLGEHLYSTPMVALRELVQNAHDSCHRRRIEDRDSEFRPHIEVRTNHGQRTLTIEDRGAGLTRDEIEKYLATVGSGYTRTLRESGQDAGLIGFFGLGFLSAFVVAERTEVHTCSYREPGRAWLFSSRAGHSYTIRSAPDRPVGTAVTLHLQAKFAELSNLQVVRTLLERYCCLLEFPVHCGPEGPVNVQPPPWRDRAEHSALRRKKLAMEFAERFESRFRPLFTMPVSTLDPNDPNDPDDDPGDESGDDPGDGRAAASGGLLWIQDSATYGTSDNRNVWVFVRGMMVTDEDRDLLPAWAGFVGAVLESDALTPTASRESLQKNRAYRTAQYTLRENLIAGLASIARTEIESWQRLLLRHNEALLGAALDDDRLFTLLADELTIPTSQGELTVARVLDLSGGRIHISQSEHSGFEELLFRALKVPVVRGTRFAALPFCKRYAERIRGALVILGTADDQALFRPGTLPEPDSERLQSWFAADDAQVVLAHFEPAYLPLILVPDREVELKRRMESDETRRSISTAALRLAHMFTNSIDDRPAARLYVNLDCPAIHALLSAPDDRRDLALEFLRGLASLSTEPQQAGRFMDVDEALERLSSAIQTLLGS